MKVRFPGHYKLDDQDIGEVWERGVIILDTNSLLNLYRYRPKTRTALLDSLKQLRERLHLPYQVATEFQHRRIDVIEGVYVGFDTVVKCVEKSVGELEEFTRGAGMRHPYYSIPKHQKDLLDPIRRHLAALRKIRSDFPDRRRQDSIRDEIDHIFEGKLGERPSDAWLDEVRRDGDKRYAKNQPPGYEDAKKKVGDAKFGDLIIWKQILEFSKNNDKSIIFVTDDRKEDWWQISRGETIGPRPELANELHEFANTKLLMYSSDRFAEHSARLLKKTISQDKVEEIKSISRRPFLDSLINESYFVNSLEKDKFKFETPIIKPTNSMGGSGGIGLPELQLSPVVKDAILRTALVNALMGETPSSTGEARLGDGASSSDDKERSQNK